MAKKAVKKAASEKKAAPKKAPKKSAAVDAAVDAAGAAPAATDSAATDSAAPATASTRRPRISTNVATALRPDERKALEKFAQKEGRSVSSILRESALKAAGIKYVERAPGRPPKAE